MSAAADVADVAVVVVVVVVGAAAFISVIYKSSLPVNHNTCL